MLKRKFATSLVISFTILLIAACGDDSSDEDNEDTVEQTDESGSDGENEAGESEADTPEAVEEPFEAIEPSEEAVSLENHYDEHQTSYIPGVDAYGEYIERSVSLGDVLPDDHEDLSDGPLNNYRLVMFYGTPLSD